MLQLSMLKNRTPAIMGESKVHHSAVAITLLEAPDGPEVLFEVRSESVGHQPGDVCLPGGMVEEGETFEEAALRETMEELLVDRKQLEMLMPSDIFQTGGLQVHPFAIRLESYDGKFSKAEVAEVFRVPLRFFLETEPEVHEALWRVELGEDFPFEKIHGGRNYGWRERKDRILFYEYGGHVIWGMTAKIMESFAGILRGEKAKDSCETHRD